jgi:uncharacterized coiled-coil DUF342 family protein
VPNPGFMEEKNMSDKDAFVQKLHSKINEWNADIDKLKGKADEVKAKLRLEYEKEIENLQQRRQEVEERLTKVRHAGEDGWQELKAGAQNAWDAMEEALRSARSKLR